MIRASASAPLFWLCSLAVAQVHPDVTLALANYGSVRIEHPQFLEPGPAADTIVPRLSFTAVNQTRTPWAAIVLRFDIGALCNGEARQWAQTVRFSLGWAPDSTISRQIADLNIPLVDHVAGCRTEMLEARLLSAQTGAPIRDISGPSGDIPDFAPQLHEIQTVREAEATKEAERQRAEAEAQAKTDAAEAEQEKIEEAARSKKEAAEAQRRKRLAAEKKKQDADKAAALARYEEAQAARVRTTCADLYSKTSNKKLSDLTVKEDQGIRACQALQLYPPD